MVPISALLPSWLELAGLAGILFAGLVLMLCGRLVTAARFVPELELFAGWGAFSFVLTLWGVATMRSMAIPATLFMLLAAATLAVPRLRPRRDDWIGILRILLLAVPIWAIMVAAKPALPDTFTNFLPNAVYLYDHGFFPADARAHAFAVWPAFPYNQQLATYLASFYLPGFPPNALTLFNILLQVMLGLLFARILLEKQQDFAAAPSWAACAGGLLLVTLLNPGFVPRIHFTAYAEPGLTVGVVLIAWLACRILGDLAERRAGVGRELWLLALFLVALIGIKQVGIVLAFGVMASVVALALADRRITGRQAILLPALAAVPGLILYGVWRDYVLTHFTSGELKLLPESQWHFGTLPATLENMAVEIWEKPLFFATLALAIVIAIRLLPREGLTQRTRLPLVLLGLFLVYNAFLILIYAIHMGPVAGEAAHSYFRYMTHQSLLVVLALTIFVRDWWLTRRTAGRLPGWRRAVPALAVALILLAPIGFVKRLRFDLRPPQPQVRLLARDLAGAVKDGEKIALLLPGDNGSVSLMLRASLELTPPRRRDLEFLDVSQDPQGLDAAAERGYRTAFLSCAPATNGDGEAAALLVYRDGKWRRAKSWAYPPVAKGSWTGVLAAEPLCREAREAAVAG